MSEQLTLMGAVAMGFFGTPWPVVLVLGLLLALLTINRANATARSYSKLGTTRVFALAFSLSATYALLFATLSFGLGRGIAYLLMS